MLLCLDKAKSIRSVNPKNQSWCSSPQPLALASIVHPTSGTRAPGVLLAHAPQLICLCMPSTHDTRWLLPGLQAGRWCLKIVVPEAFNPFRSQHVRQVQERTPHRQEYTGSGSNAPNPNHQNTNKSKRHLFVFFTTPPRRSAASVLDSETSPSNIAEC
jgi:hypothetical protein|mmetsp:Transcript_60220/g.99472  ORF Transcript_60220/g.99472 Transcript_60220/m.99472 type:complete len:158 (-) Transcript_60220:1112-1585(-)